MVMEPIAVHLRTAMPEALVSYVTWAAIPWDRPQLALQLDVCCQAPSALLLGL